MAEVQYMHVCDYAFPGESGKPCIIGIFEVIHARTFPVVHPFMAIAIELRGSPHEFVPLKIEIRRPDGESLLATEGQVAVNEHGAAFMNFRLLNIELPEAGLYLVNVSSGNRTLASHSLRVQQVSAGPPPAGPRKTSKPH